ncbi:MAG: phosphate ABC transporter permease family protein, partial [Paracoccaceae bacterium]
MSVLLLVLIVLAIAAAGFFLGRGRAVSSASGDIRALHSLPGYYGWHVAIMAAIPALLALAVWLVVQPLVIENRLAAHFPPDVVASDADRTLLMGDVRRLAAGLDAVVGQGAMTNEDATGVVADGALRKRLADAGVALGSEVTPEVLTAAQDYRALSRKGALGRSILTLLLALGGLA